MAALSAGSGTLSTSSLALLVGGEAARGRYFCPAAKRPDGGEACADGMIVKVSARPEMAMRAR